jgi:hypothetical protein
MDIPYKKIFPGTIGDITELDESAIRVILKNKVLLETMRAWLSSERGEYRWVKARRQDITCPQCGGKQDWRPKKPLFKKPIPLDPQFLPIIDWRWQDIGPEVPAWLERVRQWHPELFDATKSDVFSEVLLYLGDGLEGALGNDPSETTTRAMWPFGAQRLIDGASAWPLVVPGLAGDLAKDLMATSGPLQAVSSAFLIKDKPEMSRNEIALQFSFQTDDGLYSAWAVILNGRVVRTQTAKLP